jgi:hypothetical protein
LLLVQRYLELLTDLLAGFALDPLPFLLPIDRTERDGRTPATIASGMNAALA